MVHNVRVRDAFYVCATSDCHGAGHSLGMPARHAHGCLLTTRQISRGADNHALDERLKAARSNLRFQDRRIADLEARLTEHANPTKRQFSIRNVRKPFDLRTRIR